METKLIEIRDRMTLIPALAVLVSGLDGALARRAGYGAPCVLLTKLHGGGPAHCDAYDWGDRTMQTAHLWLGEHWNEVPNGGVVDVEFALGETEKPKTPEAGGDELRVRAELTQQPPRCRNVGGEG